MNLEDVKAKCTGVSIGTINLGNEYSLTEEVKWLIEQVEKQQREIEYLENRKEEILVESGKRWTKLLKIRDILGNQL